MKELAYRRIGASLALLLVMLGFGSVLRPQSALAYNVVLEPASGPAGTLITAYGSDFGANDPLVVTWDDNTLLANTSADASGSFVVQFAVPTNASEGFHTIYFTRPLDGGGTTYFWTANFTVISAPQPGLADLEISYAFAVFHSEPDIICSDLPVTIVAGIANAGDAATGSFGVEWWISDTWKYQTYEASLSPGESSENSYAISGLGAGNWSVWVIPDFEGTIPEYNEDNMVRVDFTVSDCQGGSVDLYVSEIELVNIGEGPICAYQDITFRAHIFNDGTAPSGIFGVRWNADGQIFNGSHDSMDSGAYDTYDHIWYDITPGHHTLIFTADPENQVPEFDEENNQVSRSFVVEECPDPSPTASPTVTATPTQSPTASPTASPTSSPTSTPNPIPSGTLHYFALGDSVASGHGLTDDGSPCHRSQRAYPYVVEDLLEVRYFPQDVTLHHYACSGAAARESGSLDDESQWLWHQVDTARGEIQEVARTQPGQPILVSITIGANDLQLLELNPLKADVSGFYQLYQYLLNEDRDTFDRWLYERLSEMQSSLRRAIDALLAVPNVRIVITEVVNPLNRKSSVFALVDGPKLELGYCERTNCYSKIDYTFQVLNAALSAVSSEYGETGRVLTTVGLYSAFKGREAPGGTLCGSQQLSKATWFQFPGDVLNDFYGDCVHPNRDGANAYAGAVELATLRFDGLQIGETDAVARTWMEADGPVSDGVVNRTWMWGPTANSALIAEPYVDSPIGMRAVQYFDKSRMEIGDPEGDPNSPWYVTNGLLVMELVTGRMQLGDSTFAQGEPAWVNVAGDADDSTGPTYATFSGLLGYGQPIGSVIVQRVDRNGSVSEDQALAGYGVTAAQYVPETGHNVASVFWAFMSSTGVVYKDGQYINDLLFPNPFYATGFPITEAFWAQVKVAGTYKYVLMQCFERRCLTYTPDNPDGWKVEAGNVGQHYYAWRYESNTGNPDPDPAPDPAGSETITVPFTSGNAGVTTSHAYSGPVTITVSGVGFSTVGTVSEDAFYVLTDVNGDPIDPVHQADYNPLWINGGPASDFLSSVPAYRSDHVYTFTINAPGGPLSFGIGDPYTVDNDGEFTVTINPG